MNRFQNILAYVSPLQSEQPGLEFAVQMAKDNGASLKVMSVVPNEPWYYRFLGSSDSAQSLEVESMAKSHLQGWLDTLGRPKSVSLAVRRGNAGHCILQEVARYSHDLVIKTAEGVGEQHFGPTGMALLRKCACPVWISPPGPLQAPKHVMAAINPDPTDPESMALQTTILQLADSLAAQHNARFTALHVFGSSYDDILRGYMPESRFMELSLGAYRDAEIRIREFVEQVPELSAQPDMEVRRGDPAPELLRFTRKQSVDVLVMGTLGRSGIQGMFIGNTAERVLGEIDCTLLALKPAGFMSPVGESEES